MQGRGEERCAKLQRIARGGTPYLPRRSLAAAGVCSGPTGSMMDQTGERR